jgi:hypothetical protein
MLACQRGGEGPKVASSAEQVGYAERYPDELQRVEGNVTREHELGASFAQFKEFPSELGETDWNLVHQIYETADEEGRGQAYAQRFEEQATVGRFFEEEKKPIVGRVSGAVTFSAKEKGIEDFQPYGPVNFGLEKGIEQQLEDRRRADSTAQISIEEQEEALGQKNVPVLQKQADTLSLASHLVYVRALRDEQELTRLVDESSQVRSTLEERKEALSKAQKPNKAALERTDKALAALDERVEKAKAALDGAEQRRQKLQQDYDAALKALLDDVSDRASAQAK